MTRETALRNVYKALETRLSDSGEPWGSHAYMAQAHENAPYPYVVYFWAGGGEANRRRHQDAELVIIVKAVSDNAGEAFDCAARIAELLNDHGTQDNAADYVYGGSEWEIMTVTQEETLHLHEQFANTKALTHAGARYRFVMEAT